MEFIDVQAQYVALKKEIDEEIHQVLDSGHFIMGPAVVEFENELAAYLGVEHVVACGNGTDALQLLYMAYGIKPGDAVFVPDMTFIATEEPACLLGAEPVFCDIDPESHNISPKALEAKIAEVKADGRLRPRFIVAVDFLGNPCNWEKLEAIAEKHDLILIEDAAQATGGRYKNRMCGAFGHAATTSFFPTKPLACFGDGGAIMTNDAQIADVLRSLRMHGKGSSKYDNIRIGVNSRLDTIQAAILKVKLRHLEEEMERRQEVAAYYTQALEDYVQCPHIEKEARSAYAQYVLYAKSQAERDAIVETLKGEEIPTLIYYPKEQHALPIFAELPSAKQEYHVSTSFIKHSVCLPFSPYLKKADQNRVIEAVKKALG